MSFFAQATRDVFLQKHAPRYLYFLLLNENQRIAVIDRQLLTQTRIIS